VTLNMPTRCGHPI